MLQECGGNEQKGEFGRDTCNWRMENYGDGKRLCEAKGGGHQGQNYLEQDFTY